MGTRKWDTVVSKKKGWGDRDRREERSERQSLVVGATTGKVGKKEGGN